MSIRSFNREARLLLSQPATMTTMAQLGSVPCSSFVKQEADIGMSSSGSSFLSSARLALQSNVPATSRRRSRAAQAVATPTRTWTVTNRPDSKQENTNSTAGTKSPGSKQASANSTTETNRPGSKQESANLITGTSRLSSKQKSAKTITGTNRLRSKQESSKSTTDNGSFLLSALMGKLEAATSQIQTAVQEATTQALNDFVERTFEPIDEPNLAYQGNYGPVEEIGERRAVKIVAGDIPKDFPPGVYIRNGPNPHCGGKTRKSPFGKLKYHWFEGDGMMHATYFYGDGRVPEFLNKYVGTQAYVTEKARGKSLYLSTFEGGPPALILGYLLNQVRFGNVMKWTSNTGVLRIGKKWFASMESGLPLEINPWDLSTTEGAPYNVNGAWTNTMIAHPKTDHNTGELVTIGWDGMLSNLQLGIISADGQRLVHKADLGFKRFSFMHEVAITEKYNIILDWALNAGLNSILSHGQSFEFKTGPDARVGVMPRYGDADSIKWFSVKPNFAFHVLNSFDDGDEAVLLGMSMRVPGITSPPTEGVDSGIDTRQWIARGYTPTKVEDAADPLIDGALFCRIHEWRMNMRTGTVTERDLTGDNLSLEMPRINEKYTGKKNRYAYALAAYTKENHMTFGRLVKIDLSSVPLEAAASGSIDLPRIEEHAIAADGHCSEPFFVARPGGVEEDDGWVVAYVHDESTGISEMIIIDAQDFKGKSVVRLQLPQRVPYGFHGEYVLSK